jgi:uncharacterized protein (UPF0332 family)
MAAISGHGYKTLADDLVAKTVAGGCYSEDYLKDAALRTAISRYYFAAYLHMDALCRAHGVQLKANVEDHATVYKAVLFINEAVANALDNLRDARNTADYGRPCNLAQKAASAKLAAETVLAYNGRVALPGGQS